VCRNFETATMRKGRPPASLYIRRGVLMKNPRRGNQLGIVSVILSVAFWVYSSGSSSVSQDAFTRSPYVLYVLLPGTLVAAALAAIAAAFWGSKWWLLALLGPLLGTMLLLSASV
jgi:hypothetical protein